MKAQLASPGFTHIYAALAAVLNTKLPENGELLLKRVPTDDSVEIAVNFTKEVGQLLDQVSPAGLLAVFERFRGILHEGAIDKRVQYTIEGLFALRKTGFLEYPAVPEELDLVERGPDHARTVADDKIDKEDLLDVFRVDDDFEAHEAAWADIKREILGDDESGSDDDDEEDDDDGAEPTAATPAVGGPIQDLTETDLVNLRRTIYLTIMSSVGFEECAHKLMKLDIRPGLEMELCNMLIECCSQERTYLRYYGLLGQRFCVTTRVWQDAFDKAFEEQYMRDVFAGLFPRENPRDTRFSINFFTSIGLGGLTDALRSTSGRAKLVMQQQMAAPRPPWPTTTADSDSDSSSSSSSSSARRRRPPRRRPGLVVGSSSCLVACPRRLVPSSSRLSSSDSGK
ncbi:hypothetical protein JL722_11421 [Aureococcus anophagefferens]|nr:hypothetical protein JL722_11421 [Aureococcus anophagefferens]